MALQGSLDTFALPDVLRLLATTAKTGRLRIEGDRGHGSVWLRDGTVMAAAADRATEDAPAEEVIFELLRFEEGSFAFDMDELSPNGEQPEDVEILLRNAGSLLSEWNELEGIVPSLDHRVKLVESLPKGDVTIDSRRWPSLVAVASGRTVRDVASTLGLSELGVTRAVRDLVDIGVAEIDEPSEESSVEATMPPAGRREVPRDEMARRSPFSSLGSGETLATSMPRTDGLTLDPDLQRAGWLHSPERSSGSQAAVPDGLSPTAKGGRGNGSSGNGVGPAGPGPLGSPSLGSPGSSDPSAPGSLGSPGSSGPSAGSDIPSRLGRPGSGAGSAAGGSSGSGSSKRSGSSRSSGSGRSSGSRSSGPSRSSSSRSAGSGRSSGSKRPGRSGAGTGAGASGSTRDPSGESRRPSAPGGPGSSNGEPPSRLGKTRPPSAPRRNGPSGPTRPPVLPDTGPLSMPPVSPTAFDAGPLGPSPLPADTGQIRPVSPSALPPDLQWAVDDDTGAGMPPAGPIGGPIAGQGFANGTNGGGPMGANPPMAGPPIDPNKVAPHVAAMSPEARAAVQGTVGNTGGAASGLGPGDELAQRGQLLNFLSSVKP